MSSAIPDPELRRGERGRPYPAPLRVVQKVVTLAHRALYNASGGRLVGTMGDNRVIILTTTGRRSGQPRRAPLFGHRDGDSWLVVASNGGTASHPDWFANLMVDPRGRVKDGDQDVAVRAEVLSLEEKAEWWPTLVERYGGYASYQSRTDREIPVLRLRAVT